MQSCFDEVKKNFGFGCMRLPMKGKEVDFEETSKMVDMFLANGFNYFDTAHGYLDGQSEIALKKMPDLPLSPGGVHSDQQAVRPLH